MTNMTSDFRLDPYAVWADEIQGERDRIEADEEARKAHQEEAIRKAAQRVADGTHSPIDAYNAAYPLPMALEMFGNIRHGERYLSPNSESGIPGVTISEEGQKWFSAHQSDADIGVTTTNGTMGDAFDLFVYYTHGGDYEAALKAAGEMFKVDGVTITKANQRAYMERQNEVTADDFDFSDSNPLSQFSLNGESKNMEKKMLEDKHILGKLAILGQWTLFYGKPNAGKTLITICLLIVAILAGLIKGKDVFYINADDTHKGLVHKLKLAEKYGFNMLAPGYKGFKAEMLVVIIRKLIEAGTASGKVLILDTIKKFTDIMSKAKSSEFAEAVRQFVLHGGSVIALAHTNKHRGKDGKVIYAGTSDLVEDADCAYTLDIVTEDKFEGTRVVKFENFKNRGDVALEASYEYNAAPSLPYEHRLGSVRSLEDKEIESAENYREREKLYLKNKEVVVEIQEALEENGPMNQKDLAAKVMGNSGFSKSRIVKVLKAHTGLNVKSFQLWYVNKSGEKNEKIYTLNDGIRGGG